MGPPFEAVFLGDNGQGDVQVPSNLGKLVVLVLWIRKCRLPATWPCLAHPLWQPSFIKSRRERLGARDRFDKGPEGRFSGGPRQWTIRAFAISMVTWKLPR